jgi:hypothetical protein
MALIKNIIASIAIKYTLIPIDWMEKIGFAVINVRIGYFCGNLSKKHH